MSVALAANADGAPSSGSLSGALTATTNVAGIARFTSLGLTGLIDENYKLVFSSGVLTVESTVISPTVAGATHVLSITIQPVLGIWDGMGNA